MSVLWRNGVECAHKVYSNHECSLYKDHNIYRKIMIFIEKAKTLLKSSVMQTHYKVPSQLQVNCIKYQNNYHTIFINEHKHVISTLKTFTDLNEYLHPTPPC